MCDGVPNATIAKYNVAIFGPGAASHRPALEASLRGRLRELGEDLEAFVAFLDAAQVLTRDAKTPTVGVYFGAGISDPLDERAAQSLTEVAAVVVPVVRDLDQYSAMVPPVLAGINGMAVPGDDPDLNEIANLVLENLGLLRRVRRLFISYRRTDSGQVALQLHHELEARGYDVFLDIHSVPKGDDFQEVLWQRMADSDIVILLDSPNFLAGRWTKEELAQAEAMTIGLVQLVWPNHTPAPYTDLCERLYLDEADFQGQVLDGSLTAVASSRVAQAVEQLRARSIAARHNNLVREFCDAAAMASIAATVQPERYIAAQLPSGPLVAIPAVGIPDALRYHDASRWLASNTGARTTVLLVYDQRGLRPRWGAFIDWLDEFLPVKAIRITSVAEKLATL